MFLARCAIVIPDSDVPGAVGDVCQKYSATLKLFRKTAQSSPTSLTLQEVADEKVDVFHSGEDPLEAGVDTLVWQTVDEVWVSECQY